MADFFQQTWDSQLEQDCRQLIQLAQTEDLHPPHSLTEGRERAIPGDLTTLSLVPAGVPASACVVARQPGVVAGLEVGPLTLEAYQGAPKSCEWLALVADGTQVTAGTKLAVMRGPARTLLSAERVILNLLGHASGVATRTRAFVDAVGKTSARIYDTRKTLPGYRRLDKYAVRQGGGWNHRSSLAEAVLIKDNHLALGGQTGGYSPAQAVTIARQRATENNAPGGKLPLVEVEVDTLEQLREVLPAQPDIVLLDNMSPETLREAIALRKALAPNVVLEASGGVRLDTVASIAATGVERISVGSLTHSAPWWDVGLDWE